MPLSALRDDREGLGALSRCGARDREDAEEREQAL
jgi:hypothetical protein